uniref:Unc-45 myosin chaperone A n=1 Tax=Chelonoidis abingdonii TaxID=106734 RepID=A0A8C0GUH4_CHEAB
MEGNVSRRGGSQARVLGGRRGGVRSWGGGPDGGVSRLAGGRARGPGCGLGGARGVSRLLGRGRNVGVWGGRTGGVSRLAGAERGGPRLGVPGGRRVPAPGGGADVGSWGAGRGVSPARGAERGAAAVPGGGGRGSVPAAWGRGPARGGEAGGRVRGGGDSGAGPPERLFARGRRDWRQEGNRLFQAGDYAAALPPNTRAWSLCAGPPEAPVLHATGPPATLKLVSGGRAPGPWRAIEADGHDVKALFRRSQALQKLGRLDQAVYDLRRCVSLEPRNKAFQEALHDLGSSMQEKMKFMSCTDSKVEQMFQILLDPKETDTDKKQKAAQNLIVLAREEAGAEKIFQSDGVRLLLRMLDTGREDVMLAALRTLAGLCSGHRSRTMAILAELGAPRVSAMLGVEHKQVSLAACNLLQVMFDALKEGLQRDFRGKEEALVLDPSKELKLLIGHLLEMLNREGTSAHGRDNTLNLLIKVVPRKSLRDPNNSLTLWVIDQGLKKILEVGGTVCEAPDSLTVTENSRMSAAILLSRLYSDLKCDAERENFHRLCEDYVRSWFEGHGLAGKLRAIQTASCLLQGPSEAGNQVLELEGIMESVLALCASVREVDQLVAVEALIHAADKAKRASFITANGVTLLKNIYKCSGRDSIRIRALVGLCKLGSAGGTDFSMKQFAEGSTLKLAKQCRKWLCNEAIDAGTRRWAVEGLAYLTFDADVKEEFVEDKAAVQAMFQLAKVCLQSIAPVLFAPDPQMLELAKYAKQHVPERHPKDEPGCVRRRVRKLLAAGVVSALTCMVKSENPVLTNSCRELISRVFLAVVEEAADRGSVVAQGGGKALIPLSLEGTEVGQAKAAQALAKITITSNPDMAFPGERIYEVVRPLVSLLHLHRTGLENFEGLMALTNLAGISERLRQKILKEKAVPMIEGYMFEEHELLRLAATECMCNMAMSTEVQELFLAEGSDRLKLLVLYSGEDDEKLRRAASGTLAMLTSVLPQICGKVTQVTAHWLEILQALLLSPNVELQHRGTVIVLNMMAADREIAAKLMESEMLEILSVLAKEERNKPRVAQAAKECLAQAVAYGLIKPNVNGE